MFSIFNRLLAELAEDDVHSCTDSNQCCGFVYYEFRAAACALRDDSGLGTSMQSFIDRAYQEMSSSRSSASFCWRRLYTDACLFYALSKVLNPANVDEAAAVEAIAALDRATIIAGAPGRSDLINELIQDVQLNHLTLEPLQVSSDHTAQQPLTQVYHPNSISVDVPRSHPPPSPFGMEWSERPFVLQSYGHVQNWKALSSWASFEYLRSVAGPGRIVPVEVGKDYRTEEWTQRLMSWDSFLQSLQSPAQPQNEVLFLAQHNLFLQFPALQCDIGIPEYVYACPDPPSCYPTYNPPGNLDRLIINVWLGPRGTISPAHTDPFFNCYAQIVGRKTVWLAPPEVSNSMYPLTSDTADKSPAANASEPLMSNTSRVDVFPESAEAEQASRHAFPAFWNEVPPKAMCTTLCPGDVLLFPPGWWHAMRSEETSFSVSMWF